MKKTIIIGLVIVLFSLLMMPNISTMEYNVVQKEQQIQIQQIIDVDIISLFNKARILDDDYCYESFIGTSVFQNLVDILIFFFTTFFKIIGSIISISAEVFGTLISIIASIIVSIISIVAQITGSIINILASLIGPVLKLIIRLIGKTVSILFKTLGFIVGTLGSVINGIAKIIGTIFETIGRLIERIITFLFSSNLAMSSI